ncbi:MAG: hypothetical protein WCI61_08810, partial [Chloroflexota bacterium]
LWAVSRQAGREGHAKWLGAASKDVGLSRPACRETAQSGKERVAAAGSLGRHLRVASEFPSALEKHRYIERNWNSL